MKTFRTKHITLWAFCLFLIGFPISGNAQFLTKNLSSCSGTENDTIAKSQFLEMDVSERQDHPNQVNDSIVQANKRQLEAINTAADTVQLYAASDSVSLGNSTAKPFKKQFVPDPQRALWLSLVLPGAGQIYNRKYWKLPIIYGGFLGCTYALLWNQQMYMDYSQAYLDIMDDDPNTNSYKDLLPPRYDITGQEDRFKKIFKNKKDHFRRYRDLSAFCFVGVYLLSVVDAYVDAQLSEFDITPDLSLRLEPAVIQPQGLNNHKNAYGVGCSFNF